MGESGCDNVVAGLRRELELGKSVNAINATEPHGAAATCDCGGSEAAEERRTRARNRQRMGVQSRAAHFTMARGGRAVVVVVVVVRSTCGQGGLLWWRVGRVKVASARQASKHQEGQGRTSRTLIPPPPQPISTPVD